MADNSTAFDETDLVRWLHRLQEKRPASPSITECLTCTEVESFNGRGLKRGIVLRLALDDGKHITFRIDPVAAHNLLAQITEAGRVCGWLDEWRITDPPEQYSPRVAE